VAEKIWTRVSITNAATRLDAEGASYAYLTLYNRAAASIYIGDSTVTTATGFQLDAGEAIVINAGSAHRGWYAIAATAGPHSIHRIGMAG
jgi:hypothetical protein